ncbi:hypothetical protein G9A89_008954 [Geosiphon pyriformis]|nr:hypothetical protein G9A89_008954 [Geosiphon pyriformis]
MNSSSTSEVRHKHPANELVMHKTEEVLEAYAKAGDAFKRAGLLLKDLAQKVEELREILPENMCIKLPTNLSNHFTNLSFDWEETFAPKYKSNEQIKTQRNQIPVTINSFPNFSELEQGVKDEVMQIVVPSSSNSNADEETSEQEESKDLVANPEKIPISFRSLLCPKQDKINASKQLKPDKDITNLTIPTSKNTQIRGIMESSLPENFPQSNPIQNLKDLSKSVNPPFSPFLTKSTGNLKKALNQDSMNQLPSLIQRKTGISSLHIPTMEMEIEPSPNNLSFGSNYDHPCYSQKIFPIYSFWNTVEHSNRFQAPSISLLNKSLKTSPRSNRCGKSTYKSGNRFKPYGNQQTIKREHKQAEKNDVNNSRIKFPHYPHNIFHPFSPEARERPDYDEPVERANKDQGPIFLSFFLNGISHQTTEASNWWQEVTKNIYYPQPLTAEEHTLIDNFIQYAGLRLKDPKCTQSQIANEIIALSNNTCKISQGSVSTMMRRIAVPKPPQTRAAIRNWVEHEKARCSRETAE